MGAVLKAKLAIAKTSVLVADRKVKFVTLKTSTAAARSKRDCTLVDI